MDTKAPCVYALPVLEWTTHAEPVVVAIFFAGVRARRRRLGTLPVNVTYLGAEMGVREDQLSYQPLIGQVISGIPKLFPFCSHFPDSIERAYYRLQVLLAQMAIA
jgi:hypothetical protein